MMFQRRWCHYQLKREITEFEVIERDNKLNKQFHLSGCMFGESAYAYFLPCFKQVWLSDACEMFLIWDKRLLKIQLLI